MFHRSELGDHAHKFPADRDGHVPEHHDHWRNMNFDHGEHDPHEPGISEEERQRRVAYLDHNWWPKIIAHVNDEKQKLAQSPQGMPIHRWRQQVMEEPPQQHGFEAGEMD